MNFVLCGMMGSGKTQLGKLLAGKLGFSWVDTDALLVSRYGEIAEQFSRFGESVFRMRESEVVKELSEKDGFVISTGGGVVLRSENVENLKRNGKILFLRAKKETLLERLQGRVNRPLLQGDGRLEEKIERFLSERTPVYENTADFVLDVDGYTAEENVERALLLLTGAGTK